MVSKELIWKLWSPFQIQLTASIHKRPLQATWFPIAASTMYAAAVREPKLLFVTAVICNWSGLEPALPRSWFCGHQSKSKSKHNPMLCFQFKTRIRSLCWERQQYEAKKWQNNDHSYLHWPQCLIVYKVVYLMEYV